MEKRAQVTTFVIVGIVIIALAVLFLYARSLGFGISSEGFLASKKASIESRINECARTEAAKVLEVMGRQGGTLTPLKFKTFNNARINYLCYNIPGSDQCVNRILTLKTMEDELSRYLETSIRNCIRIDEFKTSGLSLQPGNLEIITTIGQDDVLVIVDYPITLARDNARLTLSRFTSKVNIPLGRLYLAAIEAIDSEASVGDFDPLPYMLVHNLVRIEKHRPFPDKVYVMNIRTVPYIFQFAIEGEP